MFVFAVIKTGGKQYVVKPGDKIKVEKIEANVGDTVEISEVLLVNKDGEIKLGTPLVEGVKVIASVVEHSKGPKVIVFKKKPKKGYKRKRGHRQLITTLEIKEILE
nr:50S ribosomal protein L21 [Thermodesulfobacterium sp.]